jgi:ribosomal protein S24E
MEFKIINEVYNPLMKRKEIKAEILHQAAGTPDRFSIRKELASKFNEDLEKLYIVKMVTKTGTNKTICDIEVYNEKEAAELIVPKYIFIRNLPPEERKKALEEKEKKKKTKIEESKKK